MRSRHPDLLRRHDIPTTDPSPTTDRPAKDAAKSMPIRLVTSGLRPGVTSVIPTTAAHAGAGDGYATKDLAKQISEAFDSVSVALNSADPLQYAEVIF